ncbi:prepilin-type N-terminal cleavage/methylation domain-containing protein [Brevundimonas aurantiaca]|jgi:prepilin-type N-terminal cleavage/methylation domain-containing protein|uniref:prepilin-type N-terminal cleavage/methylation domain-containing protein n=1 Tax=Brevundimonas aurantiaca TaxID=74316 RepID=UPI0017492E78|nr:prepilin-type N-terminal cleavage/methylation domain-containing protein [Brevundimonas aurantiaca]
MESRAPRQGFSLIEALVVLAIGGMALAVIFSIGVKAGDSGFKLGRRAMAAADQDIAVGDFRSLARSITLRPAATLKPALDRPIVGRADRLDVDVVTERATGCAPAGFAGRISLIIERTPETFTLVCEALGRRAVLATGSDAAAKFSYSQDGVRWSDEYMSAAAPSFSSDRSLRSVSLFVRFTGGGMDMVETATSGRPESWIRFDDPL